MMQSIADMSLNLFTSKLLPQRIKGAVNVSSMTFKCPSQQSEVGKKPSSLILDRQCFCYCSRRGRVLTTRPRILDEAHCKLRLHR